MFDDMDKVLNNHELFNKWQVFEGRKSNNFEVVPSVYITAIKLRKGFKDFTDEEIEELFNDEFDNKIAFDRHRKILHDKIEALHRWQLFKALEILLEIGRLECASYVLLCKSTDEDFENYSDND